MRIFFFVKNILYIDFMICCSMKYIKIEHSNLIPIRNMIEIYFILNVVIKSVNVGIHYMCDTCRRKHSHAQVEQKPHCSPKKRSNNNCAVKLLPLSPSMNWRVIIFRECVEYQVSGRLKCIWVDIVAAGNSSFYYTQLFLFFVHLIWKYFNQYQYKIMLL